jgi:6-phosphogluconolactonase (cycloisomerase 2 family)
MMAKRRSRSALLLTLLSALLVTVAAEAQDELFVANGFLGNSVTVYSRTASGDTAPLRTLSGAATQLFSPMSIALDLANNELFVGNSGDITVYNLTASGDAAPLRAFGGFNGNDEPADSDFIFPDALALDLTNNELFVANGLTSFNAQPFGNFVRVYSRTASGKTAPLRTLSGAATGLQDPRGLALDATNDELFVANQDGNSVTVYSRSANGNTAPVRTLSGPATGLVFPRSLALDLTNNELLVENRDSVTVYSRTASGNTAPLRTLSGPATGISGPRGLALDLTNNELLVTNAFPDTATSVTVYGRTASGNTAPLRTLSGAATGLNDPGGLALTPRLHLVASVNQPTFEPGQMLLTTAGASNPGLPGAGDFYVGIVRPDDSIQFFTNTGIVVGSLADLTSFRPIATGVPLGVPFSVTGPNFHSVQWTGDEPHGSYAFFFVALKAGALADGSLSQDDILALAAAPFSFP